MSKISWKFMSSRATSGIRDFVYSAVAVFAIAVGIPLLVDPSLMFRRGDDNLIPLLDSFCAYRIKESDLNRDGIINGDEEWRRYFAVTGEKEEIESEMGYGKPGSSVKLSDVYREFLERRN